MQCCSTDPRRVFAATTSKSPRAIPSSHPINGTQLKLILLSYARPANVDLLVRLCCIDSVDRIVVSNNNPRYRVRDIVRVRDPRLVLIDQEDHVKPGIRFVLARDEPSDLYITIDDD